MFRGHYQRRTLCIFSAAAASFCAIATPISVAQKEKSIFTLPDDVPSPPNNKPNPERIELGKMLFFDPRLSGSNRLSCENCHSLSKHWTDGMPLAKGEGSRVLKRGTPSLINVGFDDSLMWDGRFKTLEDQVWSPMLNTDEMHGVQDEVLTKLQGLPGYVRAFDKAYPGEGISQSTVAKAIASFERTLVSKDSPFDHWIQGDESALKAGAKRGFQIFTGKANCIACHQGANFTDQGFHNIGLAGSADPGRYAIVPVRILQGAFKTPTLRDVELTGPYMHNGAYRTLEQVIDHYDRGGDDKAHLDPNMKPLGLTAQEKEDLVEFLKSLTGTHESMALPQLPQQP
jgi:cytochrome c peroxidase